MSLFEMDGSWNRHKVVIAGSTGVGKTSIVQRLATGSFDGDTDPTVGVELTSIAVGVGDDQIHLGVWDTAGQERFRSVSKSYFRNAVGAILVFSLTDRDSFETLDSWLNDIHAVASANSCVLLVGNKVDLEAERIIADGEARLFADRHNLNYVEVSAKENTNVDEMVKRLASNIAVKIRTGEIQNGISGKSPPVVLQHREPAQERGGCC